MLLFFPPFGRHRAREKEKEAPSTCAFPRCLHHPWQGPKLTKKSIQTSQEDDPDLPGGRQPPGLRGLYQEGLELGIQMGTHGEAGGGVITGSLRTRPGILPSLHTFWI